MSEVRGRRRESVQVRVCVCVCVCVCGEGGKREPAVAQLQLAHGSVSRDNCRYQPAPISLM